MAQQRTLVIADDPGIRRTLRIALSQAGYHLPDKNGLEDIIEDIIEEEMATVVDQELGA